MRKSLTIKVFSPGNKEPRTYRVEQQPGREHTGAGEEMILKDVEDGIAAQWPGHEYRRVDLGGGRYNFVWVRQLFETPQERLAKLLKRTSLVER